MFSFSEPAVKELFLKIMIAICSEKQNNGAMTVDWIRKALVETGKTRSGLAKALGRSPSAVTDLLNGSRRLRAEEIAVADRICGSFVMAKRSRLYRGRISRTTAAHSRTTS